MSAYLNDVFEVIEKDLFLLAIRLDCLELEK